MVCEKITPICLNASFIFWRMKRQGVTNRSMGFWSLTNLKNQKAKSWGFKGTVLQGNGYWASEGGFYHSRTFLRS